MITIACPHCKEARAIRKHGTTSIGTPRARCRTCKKTVILAPKSRAITPHKEAAIERMLNERIPIRGICRALKVSPNTIYATLKKSRSTPTL